MNKKILTMWMMLLPLSLMMFGGYSALYAFGIAKPKSNKECVNNFYESSPVQQEISSDFFAAPEEIVSQWEPYVVTKKNYDSYYDGHQHDKKSYTTAKEPETQYVQVEPDLWTDENPNKNTKGDYKLKVGDTMLISIYGQEKTNRTVAVCPRGTISYLYVDSLPVLEKTFSEVRQELETQLKHYLRYVTLSITPIKFNAEFYTVMGDLKEPGKQPFVGRPTILTALCKAQGFNMVEYREQMWDLCNLDRAFVARDGDYVAVDFAKLVEEGDLTQNLFLEPGDFVYVPSREVKQVYVLGEVLAQKSVDFLDDMTLAEAMSDAGDVTERASSRVVVLRGALSSPTHFLVDYSRIVKGYYPDFKLQAGDIVYVPPRKLYLLREIFRAAITAFVTTAAYECGIEWFIRSHPAAGSVLNGQTLLP